jgi:SAM-dependent methyltransferase
MKRCLVCHTGYATSSKRCPECGFGPVIVDGFESYAPDLAREGGGFKSSYFLDLARLEDASFWFRSRNELIIWALKNYGQNLENFLELGCGTGYVLNGIAKHFPDTTLYGSEIFTAGLGFAARRLPSVQFMQMDARNIPFQDEYDVIGAFDVLEHIKEDDCVLAQVYEALKPQGIFLLTVPQHAWLWSSTDEYAFHVRRYAASDLHKKIEAARFSVLRSTSFVTILLPAMIISRYLHKKVTNSKFEATAELKISNRINSIFYQIIGLEMLFIKNNINLPAGGSRLVVAKKK